MTRASLVISASVVCALGADAAAVDYAKGTREAVLAGLATEVAQSSPAARERAMGKLLDAGELAVRALLPLLLRDDLEVRARVTHLIRRIRKLDLPGDPFDVFGEVVGKALVVDVQPGRKTVEVEEGDRRVRIVVTSASGITVEVAASEYGRQAREAVSAASADELSRKSREAFAVFSRWGGGPGIEWQLGDSRIERGRDGHPGPIARERADIGLRRFGEQLELMLEAKATPAAVAQSLTARFAQLQDAVAAEGKLALDSASDEQIVRTVQAIFSLTSQLRAQLADAELPNPGALLAPGPESRLGVVFRQGRATRPVVTRVLPQYRGSRMGLQVNDEILRANDRPVSNATDIRAALQAGTGPATVIVRRAGGDLVLRDGK